MARRPHLLVIMTDQQAATAMSCAGNPDLHTPAMDRLAARGVRFPRTYVAHPICVPARTSFITGRMPHETGITFNVNRHPIQVPALSPRLAAAGYDTGYFGKWHIPHDADDEAWHGFHTRVAMRANNLDDEIVDPAGAFFAKDRPADQPFAAVVSFVNPHDICEWARIATPDFDDQLKNGAIPPVPPPDECPELPANFAIPEGEPAVIREHQANPGNAGTYPVRGWDEGTWRQYRWAYYRFVELVDRRIGRLLELLDQSGHTDDTVILFTSDHGDGMGAHQWNQKNLFYEETARVPLILSGPGIRRDTVDPALSNVCLDLMPTLLDYARADLPDDLRGQSLRPLAEGRRGATGHPFVVSETNLHVGYGSPGPVNGRMVRTPRYKYVVFDAGADREQLFDLEAEPGELTDLSTRDSHAPVLATHRAMLRQWVRRTEDSFPVPA